MTPTQLHPTDLIAVPVLYGDANISLDFAVNKIMAAIQPGNYELLGTCTKSDIDFDVEPFVQMLEEVGQYKIFQDYVGDLVFYYSKNTSFRSLLTANGLHFENPYGESEPKEPNCKTMGRISNYLTKKNKWQIAQNNLIEKLVILKRV